MCTSDSLLILIGDGAFSIGFCIRPTFIKSTLKTNFHDSLQTKNFDFGVRIPVLSTDFVAVVLWNFVLCNHFHFHWPFANNSELILGVELGSAFGMCLDSMGFILALSTSFHQKYSMGLSMSQAGVGIGLFCFGPLFKWLTIEFGWRGSFLLSGAIGFHFTLLGALIFPLRRTRPSSIDAPDRIVLLELDKKTDVSKTDRLPTPSVKPQCVGLRQELFVHSSTFFWVMGSTSRV